MKWGIFASEAYCRCWGMPDLEWDIHNESQLAKVGLIEIQEHPSGLDCKSMLCLNFDHSPGHAQGWKVQHWQEYLSCVSVSDALGCRSKVCPNDYDMLAQAAALPWTCEPLSHTLTQEFNHCVDWVDCGMGFSIMEWRSWRYVPRTLRFISTVIIWQQCMQNCQEYASSISNSDRSTQYRLDSLLAK